jgi:hypothetical protein
VAAAVMVDELKELPLEYPKVEGPLLEELERVGECSKQSKNPAQAKLSRHQFFGEGLAA